MNRLTIFLDEPSNEGFLERFVVGHPFLFGLLLGSGGYMIVVAIWEVIPKWLA